MKFDALTHDADTATVGMKFILLAVYAKDAVATTPTILDAVIHDAERELIAAEAVFA